MKSFHQVWFALALLVAASPLSAQTAPPNLVGVLGAGSVDLGQTVRLSAGQFAPIPPGQLYQWRFNGADIAGATTVGYTIAAVTAAHAGTYSVVVTNAVGSSTISATLTVQALAPPVLTTPPQAATVQVGQFVSFSFSATGSFPRTYQWRKDGTDIPGATNSSFSISAVVLADAGAYSVVITNSEGSTASTAAALTVNAATPVVIDTGYPLDSSAIEANPVSFQLLLKGGSSPFAFQWLKNGAKLTGATRSQLTLSAVSLADAGRYSVVVTNILGSSTSREALLTVIPATPLTISPHPQAQSSYQGSSATFFVGFTGSQPLSAQWFKNGQPIAGAIYAYYTIDALDFSDAGDYSVALTNAAGTVTSKPATLVVNPAVLPAFISQPAGQTVNYGENITINIQTSGSPPLHYQWKKDGVPLGASFVSGTSDTRNIFAATPANSGIYTVEVNNPAGTVVSNPVVITVRPAALPVITRQPVAAQAALNRSAWIEAEVNSVGTGPLAMQWFKNGTPISGATSSNYYIGGMTASDNGDYWLMVTGPAGTVTSNAVRMTALPAAATVMPHWPSDELVSVGSPLFGVGISYPEGSPPFNLQWFKEGVAIPGATSFNLNFPSVTSADFGTYTLTISNPAGVVTSPPFRVMRSSVYPPPWLDAAQVGDIVYFLATSPARIERYNLATERWLPTTALTQTSAPTAFAPASEGVYLAYGHTLARRSPDLSTETIVANASSDITHLFVFGDWAYYSTGGFNGYATVNRTTLAPGPVTPGSTSVFSPGLRVSFRQVAIAAQMRRAFGWSVSNRIDTVSLPVDGTVTRPSLPITSLPTSSLPPGSTPPTARSFVFPGEQRLATDSGTVYSSDDLAVAGSLGQPFDDLLFRTDGTPVVLRGDTLIAFRPDALVEANRTRLPMAGLRVFARGASNFVFGAGSSTGGPFSVARVDDTAFTSISSPAPVPAPTDRYSVDKAYLGNDGIVHVYSRSLQGLVRWSANTGAFLPTIPLRGAPRFTFHQPGNARMLLVYPDGELNELALGAEPGVERPLGLITSRPLFVVDLGDLVSCYTAGNNSTACFQFIMGGSGDVRSVSDWEGTESVAWQPTLRRLYSYSDSSHALFYNTVTAAGGFVGTPDSFGSNANLIPPLRFSPDGSIAVTGNGRIVGADLVQTSALSTDVLDAAWLPDSLYTVRPSNGETQLQRWSRTSYLETGRIALRGTPIRLFRLSDTQLVAVTSAQGHAVFTVIAADLSISTSPGANVAITASPQSQSAAPGASATLAAVQTGAAGTADFQWSRNGAVLADGTGVSLTLSNIQPINAGIYTATVADATSLTTSAGAIVGVTTPNKVAGPATEVGRNIAHPNGNAYDQVLLQGTAAAVTADAGQVVRISFVDLTDDIVQVEFTGAGTLTVLLDNPVPPAPPKNYTQPSVTYMKGHAGIVVAGANETTNLSIFSVGRVTAFDPTGGFNFLLPISPTNNPANNGSSLFSGHAATSYDGIADVAFIAISSTNGKFGGLRASNASCFATKGYTGIYAPGISFTGPVFVGDINASDTATPVFIIGSSLDTRITGGDLLQANNSAVKVAGLTQLKFVAGSTSNGNALPAQTNKARLEQNGTDVTSQIVVNPGP